MSVPLWADRLSRDHVDRCAVRAGGSDRLQRGQRVRGTLLAAVDAPQAVVADRVTAVEVLDAVGAVVGGGQPVGTPLLGPARTRGGADTERAELVEGKDPVREVVEHFLDPVELVSAAATVPSCLRRRTSSTARITAGSSMSVSGREAPATQRSARRTSVGISGLRNAPGLDHLDRTRRDLQPIPGGTVTAQGQWSPPRVAGLAVRGRMQIPSGARPFHGMGSLLAG